jgi:hypothetical protein
MKPTILDATKAIAFFQAVGRDVPTRFADAVLMEMTGCTEDEANDALDDACDAETVECGVSSRTGWLTDRGRGLLRTGILPPAPSMLDRLIGGR